MSEEGKKNEERLAGVREFLEYFYHDLSPVGHSLCRCCLIPDTVAFYLVFEVGRNSVSKFFLSSPSESRGAPLVWLFCMGIMKRCALWRCHGR